MKVIGIIGGIGAGKTTVVSLIKDCVPTYIISADQIGHEILKKGHSAYQEVVEYFGTDILDENHEVIRKKLGEIVFKNTNELQVLNGITHPLICEEVKRRIRTCKKEEHYKLILVEAALLVEVGLGDLMDFIIAVYASEETRIERLKKREGFTKEQALERFKAQKKWEELKSVAQIIIDNNVSVEYTREQIKNMILKL